MGMLLDLEVGGCSKGMAQMLGGHVQVIPRDVDGERSADPNALCSEPPWDVVDADS